MSTSPESLLFYESKYEQGAEKLHGYKLELLRLLPEEPGRVLDIGCGSGVMAERIRERGHTVTGIDISENAIAKLAAKGIDGKVQDISKGLSFEDGSFDAVWFSEVIEHVSDDIDLLAEINRVLGDSGVLLLSTPNSAWFVYRILHLFGFTSSELQHKLHLHFYSLRMLRKRLRKTGFEIEVVRGRITPLLIPLGRFARLGRLLGAIGFKVENTLTRGPIAYIYWFGSVGVRFFSDELLIKAVKR